MLYHISGTDKAGARLLLQTALPILTSHGAPTDVNTCVISDAIVVGPSGEPLDNILGVTFGFPAFDAIIDGDLQALAGELATALGVPCYTLGAHVFAGFPK